MYNPNLLNCSTQPFQKPLVGHEFNSQLMATTNHTMQKDEEQLIKSFLNSQLNETLNGFIGTNSDNTTQSPLSIPSSQQKPYEHHQHSTALTNLLKYQLKQSTMERRSSTTSMNEILKMVMLAGTLGLQQQDSIDQLGSYAGLMNSYSITQDYYNIKSRSEVLEREIKQISDMSSTQDRSSLKDSVLSVLYQIIDEVLSDTKSSLPLCWSTTTCNSNNGEQLIKTLSLKWETGQYPSIQKYLQEYLSKHTFLTNQELIDLMVNSHNILEENNHISETQPTISQPFQVDNTLINDSQVEMLFPSAEDFNMVFKSLGESANPSLLISLDNSMDDSKLSSEESLTSSSNVSSPQQQITNPVNTPTTNVNSTQPLYSIIENHATNKQIVKKSNAPTSFKLPKSNNTDKNQLFGSFLLKTSSSFDTTKISKTRKSSKSAPTQPLDKQKLEADFSRGFLNWNWKDLPETKQTKTPNHHEPEIVNNI